MWWVILFPYRIRRERILNRCCDGDDGGRYGCACSDRSRSALAKDNNVETFERQPSADHLQRHGVPDAIEHRMLWPAPAISSVSSFSVVWALNSKNNGKLAGRKLFGTNWGRKKLQVSHGLLCLYYISHLTRFSIKKNHPSPPKNHIQNRK